MSSLAVNKERRGITLALPQEEARGALSEQLQNLLTSVGLSLQGADESSLPVDLLLLPNADIPSFVCGGHVQLGITCKAMLEEYHAAQVHRQTEEERMSKLHCSTFSPLLELPYGIARVSLLVPAESEVYEASDVLAGEKPVATFFTHLTTRFLRQLQAETGVDKHADVEKLIRPVTGAAESTLGLGLSEAVVCLVQGDGKSACLVDSGSTLLAAGLREVEVLLHTHSMLVQYQQPACSKLFACGGPRALSAGSANTYASTDASGGVSVGGSESDGDCTPVPSHCVHSGVHGAHGSKVQLLAQKPPPVDEAEDAEVVVVRRLLRRLQGQLQAATSCVLQFNVHVDDLESCLKVTADSRRRPCTQGLLDPDWQSVQLVVRKAGVQLVMDRLVLAGGTDVLIMSFAASRLQAVGLE